MIGLALPRVEDARYLQGAAAYVADVRLPDMGFMAVVRSPYAHARIDRVELERARSLPGVIDVFAADDIREYLRPLPAVRPFPEGLDRFRQTPLAWEKVRYVGEPIAVVIAGSRYLAEDGAELVLADLQPVQPSIEAEAEDASGARLFEGHPNLIHTIVKRAGSDPEEVMSRGYLVVEDTYRVHRHSGMPLETRGLVARPDRDGGVTLWGITKMPHHVRSAVAEILDLPVNRVRTQPVSVGGGFGVRGEFYPEDALVPLAAMRTGRPVCWIEDRREHLVGTNHSRETIWHLRVGVTSDGILVALDGTLVVDLGAYLRTLAPVELAAADLLGPYRVPAFRCEARCVLTNKMGIGTIRAPGMYEASFARERLFDRVAQRLGMDPVAFRERNLLTRDDFPYDTGLEVFGIDVVYDSADPVEALRVAAKAIEWPGGASGEVSSRRQTGRAVVPFIEHTGLGPFETARLAVEPPGVVVVSVGTTSMGQGHETTLAQIAAEALGLPLEQVRVREGNPDEVPAGIGTFASRSTVMAGNAVWRAAWELRACLNDLDPTRELSLGEILERTDHPLEVMHRFESDHMTYSYGSHAAMVELDPVLGLLRVLRYVVVADVGRVINPAIVKGQIQGAAVLGMGGALLEEIIYSPEGQPQSTSFVDYLLPTAQDVPRVEVILLDRARSPHNPLGVKGAGEVGTIAVGAALANATQEALHSEIPWIDRLPLRPDHLLNARNIGASGDDA